MLAIESQTSEDDDFEEIVNTNLESDDNQLEIRESKDTKGIFLVIPAYNEEKTVGKILEKIAKLNYKVVLVDDGSRDNTFKIAKKAKKKYPDHIFIYHHLINRGVGAATKTGMIVALKHGAKYIVTFDSDGQHAIEDIAKVCKPLQEGEAEVVIGSRLFEDMPSSKRFANTMMNLLTLIFYRINVKDSQSGLRAYKSSVVYKLDIRSDGYGALSEVTREIRRNNFKLKEVPITTIYTPETQAKGTNALVGLKILMKMILDLLR